MDFTRVISLLSSAIGVRLVGAAIGFFLQILLARWLTTAEMGGWFLMASLSAFAGLLISAGYPTLGVTALARYHALDRPGMAAKFLSRSVRDMLKWAVLLFVPGVLFVLLVDLPMETRIAIIAGLAVAPASALLRLNSSAANAVRRYMTAIIPDFIVRSLFLLLAVLAWITITGWLTLEVVAVLYVTLITFTAWYVGRLLGDNGASISRIGPVPEKISKLWRGRAWPMIAVSLSILAMADFLIVVSSFFLTKPEVAQVGVAIRLTALVGFFTQASQQFVLRDLTGALKQRDADNARSMLLRTNLACIGVIAAAFIGFAVIGEWLLGIFGSDYMEAYTVLLLLMVAQGMRALGGLNVHLLSLAGKQLLLGRVCMLSFVVIVAVAAIATPAYGINGIGIAAITGEFAWAAAVALLARKHVGWRGDLLALFSSRNDIGKKPLPNQ